MAIVTLTGTEYISQEDRYSAQEKVKEALSTYSDSLDVSVELHIDCINVYPNSTATHLPYDIDQVTHDVVEALTPFFVRTPYTTLH